MDPGDEYDEYLGIFSICYILIFIHCFFFSTPYFFREHPIFFMYMLIFLIGIFKSYPSFADITLYLSLLPLWTHTFDCKFTFTFQYTTSVPVWYLTRPIKSSSNDLFCVLTQISLSGLRILAKGNHDNIYLNSDYMLWNHSQNTSCLCKDHK